MSIWIQQNLASILICTGLLLGVAAIVVKMKRSKQNGCSACGCGCADCTSHNTGGRCGK